MNERNGQLSRLRPRIAPGYTITAPTVGKVRNSAGYSLQSNRKTREGEDHPDRNAQFNRRAVALQRSGQPVVRNQRWSISQNGKMIMKKFVAAVVLCVLFANVSIA
jgi:hypothetical protein